MTEGGAALGMGDCWTVTGGTAESWAVGSAGGAPGPTNGRATKLKDVTKGLK